MCVIGGSGTILGPIIGALFMTGLFTLSEIYFAEINPILAGLLIIIVMEFMPGGFMALVGTRLEFIKKNS
jgi:branched-chain amino acid transport system permease protein